MEDHRRQADVVPSRDGIPGGPQALESGDGAFAPVVVGDLSEQHPTLWFARGVVTLHVVAHDTAVLAAEIEMAGMRTDIDDREVLVVHRRAEQAAHQAPVGRWHQHGQLGVDREGRGQHAEVVEDGDRLAERAQQGMTLGPVAEFVDVGDAFEVRQLGPGEDPGHHDGPELLGRGGPLAQADVVAKRAAAVGQVGGLAGLAGNELVTPIEHRLGETATHRVAVESHGQAGERTVEELPGVCGPAGDVELIALVVGDN